MKTQILTTNMKIKLSELRKTIRAVLSEVFGGSPATQRSPDTSRMLHPDTLDMIADSEPETQRSPSTLPSSGVQKATGDRHEDDTTLADFIDDLDQQDTNTMSMRSLGLGRQDPENVDVEAETVPVTLRSPR